MARMTDKQWLRVQVEYENPEMSIRKLAEQFKVSDTAIRKRAKQDKWQRIDSESSQIIDEKVRTIKTLHTLEEKSSHLSEPHQDKINREVAKQLELDNVYYDLESGLAKLGLKLIQNFDDKDKYATQKYQSLTTGFKNMRSAVKDGSQVTINNQTQEHKNLNVQFTD